MKLGFALLYELKRKDVWPFGCGGLLSLLGVLVLVADNCCCWCWVVAVGGRGRKRSFDLFFLALNFFIIVLDDFCLSIAAFSKSKSNFLLIKIKCKI